MSSFLPQGNKMPTIYVDGDKLHFFEVGKGTPIIFVHGSCGGGGQWKFLTAELPLRIRDKW